MAFLLIAVLGGTLGSSERRAGYQGAVMEKFETQQRCELAAEQLREVYRIGSRTGAEQGEVRCVNLRTNEFTSH